MSKEISVICATRHKTNPGMESVDLAFYFFAKRWFPDAKVNFLKICDDSNLPQKRCSNEQVKFQSNRLPFKYGVLRDNIEELYKSDAIIFWGDFFQMAHYRKDEAARQVKLGNIDTQEKGLELADKLFLLSDAPADVLKKTIIFGGTLIFNQISDYSSQPYFAHLKNLLSNAACVRMREVFSAMTVSHITNDYNKCHLGSDCAVLLNTEAINALGRNIPHGEIISANKIGVFLHRNSAGLSKQLRFVKKIAKAAGLKAQWLPWRLNRRIKSAKRWAFPGLEIPQLNVEPSIGDLFDMLKNYTFVISDTYHICVNAWNMGIPAICIGETVSGREMDVSCGPAQAWRDKRWTFYSMFEALKYYVNVQELEDSGLMKQRIEQLTTSLGDKKDIGLITQFIRQQANNAEKELAAAVGKLLA